jgi:hypothetical protein
MLVIVRFLVLVCGAVGLGLASAAYGQTTQPAGSGTLAADEPEATGSNEPVAKPQRAEGPVPEIAEVEVVGRAEDLVGIVDSASTGRVGQVEIQRIPFLRPAEVLEVIPGLIATQHSGDGKANQYFLRGFNLDHGTDFSSYLEGVPLNMPTHAHGQGYLDLNSLIPELVEVVEYRKGPYYADVGDFSSAGTSRIGYVRRLDRSLLKVGVGENDYYRAVAATSPKLADGDLLLAAEGHFYEGPWDRDENLQKWNALAKWTRDLRFATASVFVSGYGADWDSTDQIPRRAVRQGLIDDHGNLDDDVGGKTSRYVASAMIERGKTNSTRAQAYVGYYDLDLWSNFTYFLDDPINGDEFQQSDKRVFLGLDLAQDVDVEVRGVSLLNTFGAQLRHDDIDVELYDTANRNVVSTTRDDDVKVTSLGFYWALEAYLLPWLRGNVGLRGDVYWFDVDSNTLPENSGAEHDAQFSPKVGLVLGPWASTELYLNYGRSFHSNDARGTTIRTDPTSGDPVDTVHPLVKSEGAEVGTRTTWVPGLHSTLAFWWLELDSELLYVGDAGTTEPSRASRRYGVELANYWRATDWLTLDCDFTWTDTEFKDSDPVGDDIPGAVETTVAAGASVDFTNGLFGSLRVRHFGKRPLIEDGSVKSDPTTLVNLQTGWRWQRFRYGELELTLDVLNLFDSSDDDITYFYASRLPGEPADGVEDIHFHPVEPRTVRGYVTWRF